MGISRLVVSITPLEVPTSEVRLLYWSAAGLNKKIKCRLPYCRQDWIWEEWANQYEGIEFPNHRTVNAFRSGPLFHWWDGEESADEGMLEP